MNKTLGNKLAQNKIKYEVIKHRTVYTAYDAAATMHLKLNQVAKSLLIKTNKPCQKNKKPYALVVLAADRNLDFKKLARFLTESARVMNKKNACEDYQSVAKVEIPKEGVMKAQFKVKPGAMSAFGSLYKLPVFVDKSLKGQAVFTAGSFEESIKISVSDFIKIEQAVTGNFSILKKK